MPTPRPVSNVTSENGSAPTTNDSPAAEVAARLLAAEPEPFAVLHRPESHPGAIEILFGDLTAVDLLAELPAPAGDADLPVLAVVPFRQIRERGYDVIDDGVPLLALRTRERFLLPTAELLPLLPPGPVTFTPTGYDVPDDEYERIVRTVLAEEIAAGAGSNFVIHRCLTGRFDPVAEPPARAALGALRRLLLGERRAYWTFAVHTPQSTFVGASPERHVSLDGGIARMNPISGTLRRPASGWGGPEAYATSVLDFLADDKERDELAMVVDEELKMMAMVGDHGGRVRGPYLKEMAHLTHTEYVIEGLTSMDAPEVLAATMFAPTVTGSPLRNACRVLARHERRGRRYYAGVLALIGRDAAGRSSLDSPILIRTAEIAADGQVRVAAGATLVRGSRPASELAETRSKAAGIIAALTGEPAEVSGPHDAGLDRTGSIGSDQAGVAGDPAVRAVLERRNDTLARFWLQERTVQGERGGTNLGTTDPGTAASTGTVVVVDAEDDFTGMLALVLARLGHAVEVRPWSAVAAGPALTGPEATSALAVGGSSEAAADLVVLGPGPGDPGDRSDPRIATLHRIARARLAAGAPVLGVCLGHQVLSLALGLRVERLPRPDQGRQRRVDLFGVPHRVGFYNSFSPVAPAEARDDLDLVRDDQGRVVALRGAGVTGLQFHPESVLTTNGLEILGRELDRLSPRRLQDQA
jgi:2-amino-4-deoxychorismate synthase